MSKIRLGLACVLGLSVGTIANAGLLPISTTVTPDGDNYRYTYAVMLTSNSTLTKGDSFVIYDFNGLVGGSADQPAGFSFSSQLTGGTPGRTIPNDDPNMPNLIWTYTGDTPLVGQIGLGNFSAISTVPEGNTLTDFTSRTKIEDPSGATRNEDNITGTTGPSGNNPAEENGDGDPVPGVPEPTSLLLLAAGLPLVAGVRYLRNRRREDA